MTAPHTTNPSHPARWQNASPDQRRDIITDTALSLLDQHGHDAVTIRAVANELGVGAMTLYTYIKDKHDLQREMVREGFKMLNTGCAEQSTHESQKSWRGGARAYLQFAIDHPNLYKLMFDHFIVEDDHDLLHGGFQHLFDKVKERMQAGQCGQQPAHKSLDCEARARAGRFWIALHGLATLAIAGRLVVLEGNLEQLLDDLLLHVAPDVT